MEYSLVFFDEQQLAEQEEIATPAGGFDEVLHDFGLTIVTRFAQNTITEFLELIEGARLVAHRESTSRRSKKGLKIGGRFPEDLRLFERTETKLALEALSDQSNSLQQLPNRHHSTNIDININI